MSPSTNYDNLISALAKTDAQSHLEFMERARYYRRELINYLQGKRAFSSFLYITRMKEDEMFDVSEFRKWMQEYLDEHNRQIKAGKKQSDANPWNSVEPLNLSDMPEFQFKGSNIADSIGYVMSDLVILVVLNLIFFMFAYISFLRGGVKG